MKATVFVIASYGFYAKTDDGWMVCVEALNMPSQDFDWYVLKVGDPVEIEIIKHIGDGYASGRLCIGKKTN